MCCSPCRRSSSLGPRRASPTCSGARRSNRCQPREFGAHVAPSDVIRAFTSTTVSCSSCSPHLLTNAGTAVLQPPGHAAGWKGGGLGPRRLQPVAAQVHLRPRPHDAARRRRRALLRASPTLHPPPALLYPAFVAQSPQSQHWYTSHCSIAEHGKAGAPPAEASHPSWWRP